MVTTINDDMFTSDVIQDPYKYYGALREEDPVHWNELYELWVVTRHDDLVWLTRNNEQFSSQVMANDPEVLSCAVKRVWNYAMSRGDIVDNETPVPESVVAEYVDHFKNQNLDVKSTLRAILLSEDFVSF